jgi:signal transduction histidine kinase/ligand-binding sensor domain-containing protein/AraC-like DNA-binding protein
MSRFNILFCLLSLVFFIDLVNADSIDNFPSNYVQNGVLYPQQIMFNHLLDEQQRHIKYTYSVIEDERGLIWIANQRGLSRYDGVRFVHYGMPSNQQQQKEGSVQAVKEATQSLIITDLYSYSPNKLYIATSAGLFLFNPIKETFVNFHHQDTNRYQNKSVLKPIRRLIERKNLLGDNQQLWLARKDSVSLFDLKTEKFIEHIQLQNTLPGKDISVMNVQEHQGQLWIGTFGGGLLRYDLSLKKSFQVDLGLTGIQRNIRHLLIDSNDNLWIGTIKGAYRWNIKSKKLSSYYYNKENPQGLSHDDIGTFFEDNEGRIWVGTHRGGLNLYQPHNDFFIHYPTDRTNITTQSSGSILSIKQGASGTIYIAGNSGVDYIQPDYFAFQYRHINIVNKKHMSVLHLLANRQSLIVTANKMGERASFYLKDFSQQPIPAHVANAMNQIQDSNEVLELFENSDGLFIRTMRTLFYLPENASKLVDLFSSYSASSGYFHPRTIMTDSKNNLYVYAKGGIYQFNNSNQKEPKLIKMSGTFGHELQMSAFTENDNGAAIDKKDNIWGVFNNQLHVFNIFSQKHYQIDMPFSHKEVLDIFIDRDDLVWLSTSSQGVYLYEPKNQKFTRIANSGDFGRVRVLMEDDQQKIWVGSQSGIFNISKQQRKISHYGRSKGFQGDNTEEDSFVVIDKRHIGFILTGNNLNGFVILDTQQVKNKRSSPFIAFEHLNVDGVFVQDFLSGINRKSEIKHLKLGLMATHTVQPKNLKLEYQLVGFESEATITNNNINSLSYTNLGPGNYTLKYRAQSANGVWSKYISLPINISKPFWLSLWAYIVYFVLFILLIRFIVKYRTATLEKETENLEKLVFQRTHQLKEALHQSQLLYTSISHEFRTPLTLILGPVELLKKQIGESPPNLKLSNKELQSIEENARRLLKLVDQLLSLAKSKVSKSLHKKPLNVKIKTLAIIQCLESFAAVKKVKIIYEIKDELWLYANSEQFEFILLNLVSNAIKFSPEKGTIKIHVKQTKNDIFISVSDSGAGISKGEFNKIFEPFYQIESEENEYKGSGIGLLLVKEFIEINEGKIEIQSSVGVGTTFKLVFKAFCKNKDVFLDGSTQDVLSEFVQESIEQELLITNSQKSVDSRQVINVSTKGTKLTLLIVEDNIHLLAFIEQIFIDEYHVITAQNGEEGFTRAIGMIPDVIITDVMMPKLDGISMCKKLSLDQLTQHIPIILLTAKSDDVSILEGFQSNAIDYISKPFKVEWLKQKVKNLLDVIIKQRLINRNQLVQINKKPISDMKLAESDSILEANLRKIFEKYFSDPKFGVGELADELSMSIRKLQRLTASIFDLSPNELLRDYRLNHAKVLLEAGTSVTATYLDCGFKSASYFSRAFKKSFGISPSRVSMRNRDHQQILELEINNTDLE